MTVKRKKLNLAVLRQFQLWLLVRILGVVAISSIVAVIILYLYSWQEISTNFYSAHIQLRRVSDLLLPVIGAGAVVSILSGLLLALFLPQKIAGPVYRVQKCLKFLGAGDLRVKVSLREKDIFTDLASSVNEATESLREKISEIQKDLDCLSLKIEDKDSENKIKELKVKLGKILTD